jgi:hypothetical protein
MFEIVLQRILAGLGASDQLIATMGPTLSILLAIAGGTAAAQFFKYPLSRAIADGGLFDWSVRAVAVGVTFLLSLFLTEKISWPIALVFSFLQLAFYHLSLAMIRRWWPWMEAKPMVGAIEPPLKAFEAAAQRQADKVGENSGT